MPCEHAPHGFSAVGNLLMVALADPHRLWPSSLSLRCIWQTRRFTGNKIHSLKLPAIATRASSCRRAYLWFRGRMPERSQKFVPTAVRSVSACGWTCREQDSFPPPLPIRRAARTPTTPLSGFATITAIGSTFRSPMARAACGWTRSIDPGSRNAVLRLRQQRQFEEQDRCEEHHHYLHVR